MKQCFEASRSSEGGPRVPRRGPRARLLAFLQGEMRRPESLHIYSVPGTFAQNPLHTCRRSVLRTARRRPRIPRAVFLSSGLLGCSQGPLEKVVQIRCGHQDGHQLESLHFYGVPSPRRRGLKSTEKVVAQLTTFFKKAVCEILIDRRLESLHFKARS